MPSQGYSIYVYIFYIKTTLSFFFTAAGQNQVLVLLLKNGWDESNNMQINSSCSKKVVENTRERRKKFCAFKSINKQTKSRKKAIKVGEKVSQWKVISLKLCYSIVSITDEKHSILLHETNRNRVTFKTRKNSFAFCKQ